MKHIIFALLPLALYLNEAKAFIVPDTVDLRNQPTWTAPAPADFIVHAGLDSLIIDSVSVSSSRIGGEMAQLSFWLRKGTGTTATSFKGIQVHFAGSASAPGSFVIYSGGASTPRMAVPPGTTIQIAEAIFDYCVACPTAKRAATSETGDTLKTRIVFHSGAIKDSVQFLSIQRFSSSLMPLSTKEFDPALFDLYDLNGRKVPQTKMVPSTIPVPRR